MRGKTSRVLAPLSLACCDHKHYRHKRRRCAGWLRTGGFISFACSMFYLQRLLRTAPCATMRFLAELLRAVPPLYGGATPAAHSRLHTTTYALAAQGVNTARSTARVRALLPPSRLLVRYGLAWTLGRLAPAWRAGRNAAASCGQCLFHFHLRYKRTLLLAVADTVHASSCLRRRRGTGTSRVRGICAAAVWRFTKNLPAGWQRMRGGWRLATLARRLSSGERCVLSARGYACLSGERRRRRPRQRETCAALTLPYIPSLCRARGAADEVPTLTTSLLLARADIFIVSCFRTRIRCCFAYLALSPLLLRAFRFATGRNCYLWRQVAGVAAGRRRLSGRNQPPFRPSGITFYGAVFPFWRAPFSFLTFISRINERRLLRHSSVAVSNAACHCCLPVIGICGGGW